MTIPAGFQLGPIFIYFYGIIIMLGVMAGGWLASREAKRKGVDPDLVWDALIWLLIFGIVGARLWHVLLPPQTSIEQGITTAWYLLHPLDILNTRQGGLGIPGAVLGGMLGLYFYTRKHKLSFALFADICVPGLALGQAIGRWGNFVNQELYGFPTDLPWAIHIDLPHRLQGFTEYETFHPLFLYESLWNLMNMGLLLWVSRKYYNRLKNGDILLVYLIVYPLGRFLLEFLRLDAATVGGINANQTIMAVVSALSAVWLYWRHRNQVPVEPSAGEAANS